MGFNIKTILDADCETDEVSETKEEAEETKNQIVLKRHPLVVSFFGYTILFHFLTYYDILS